jgi:aspartokinase-like uncharacterized kinase
VAVERVVIVVKVGGSLYDHPHLGPGLRAYLDALGSPVLLVPGGGAVADAVRQLDRTHRLGDEDAHWLALRALDVCAEFLTRAVGALVCASRLTVLDPYRFAADDETRPDHLPHSWDVTSDSIAARAAVVYHAERLILLKSVDVPPGTPWAEAAERGWVDPHFPNLIADAPFRTEALNFRRRLDDSAPPSTRVLYSG